MSSSYPPSPALGDKILGQLLDLVVSFLVLLGNVVECRILVGISFLPASSGAGWF